MKPTPSLLLTLLLLAAGCANPVEEKVTTTWPDGSPKEVHLTEEGLKGHEIQQFHANGKLHVRGRLVSGQRDGTWNTYRENGQPWSQVDYAAGVKQGLFRTWHTNGMPHIEGQHEAGQRTGKWDFFDDTGQLNEALDFAAKVVELAV